MRMIISRKTIRRWATTIPTLALFAALLVRPAVAQKERATAFRGATIETISGKRIEKGNVVVRDGKIEAVGADVKIPDDARVVEAEGKVVMPGIIDPAARGAGVAGGGFTRVADEFYPHHPFYRTLPRYGITNISLAPGGLGQTVALRIDPDNPEQMILSGDGNLYLPLSNSAASLKMLRDGLASTKKPEPKKGEKPPEEKPPSPADALWAKVAKGEAYLVVSADASAAVAHLAKILKEYPKVKVALLASGATVYETIDEMKKFKPLLIVQPRIETKPNTQYRINAAAIAHEAGLQIAFSTSGVSQESTRDVPLFAIAYLVKTGLPRETALKALTLAPAQAMGLEKRLGSIEPKKDANLLLFSGDPLSPGSQLERVMLEGKFIHEN